MPAAAGRAARPRRRDHRFGAEHVRAGDRTVARIDAVQVAALESLVNDATETGLLADLKSYPGRLGLETLLREITKLKLVRDLNLPSALFDGVSPRIVELWGARSTRAYRSDLLGSTRPVLLTLPATLCSARRTRSPTLSSIFSSVSFTRSCESTCWA